MSRGGPEVTVSASGERRGARSGRIQEVDKRCDSGPDSTSGKGEARGVLLIWRHKRTSRRGLFRSLHSRRKSLKTLLRAGAGLDASRSGEQAERQIRRNKGNRVVPIPQDGAGKGSHHYIFEGDGWGLAVGGRSDENGKSSLETREELGVFKQERLQSHHKGKVTN